MRTWSMFKGTPLGGRSFADSANRVLICKIKKRSVYAQILYQRQMFGYESAGAGKHLWVSDLLDTTHLLLAQAKTHIKLRAQVDKRRRALNLDKLHKHSRQHQSCRHLQATTRRQAPLGQHGHRHVAHQTSGEQVLLVLQILLPNEHPVCLGTHHNSIKHCQI